MKKEQLNNLHQLLCGQNTAKLAFKIGNGLGYSEEELIDLMWNEFMYCDRLILGNYKLDYHVEWWHLYWPGGGRNSFDKDTIIGKLIIMLKND